MAAGEPGVPTAQQEPSVAPQVVVEKNGAKDVPKDGPTVSSSDFVLYVEEKLEKFRQDDAESSRENVSIYRIPDYLKVGDKKAYTPQIVSIGPYHHGEEHLRHMEQHKWRCFHCILKRSNHEIGLYLDSIKDVEQRARTCYEGTIPMSSKDFVLMMVLDGCFVIELFRGVAEGFEKLGYPHNDPVFSTWASMIKSQIQRDMIMLENQIPLFILDQLLGLQIGDPNQKGHVARLALQFFAPLASVSSYREEFDQHGFHCLEVFRLSLLPSGPKPETTQGWLQSRQQLLPCLSELREEGIKFTTRLGCSLGDIRFSSQDETLEIPGLVIHEWTRSLFLNLIAFEQSRFDCNNDITSYIIFMHNLIDSPEDVRYLRNCKIINHCLGSDAEVADLFNRLCQEVAFERGNSYLYLLYHQVKSRLFFKRLSFGFALAQRWRAWAAILKILYFESPWSIIISIVAALVLFVLTFIQAIYAVRGYNRTGS